MKNKNILQLKYAFAALIILFLNFTVYSQKYEKKKTPKKLLEWNPDEISNLKSSRKYTIKYDLTNFLCGNNNIELGFELNLPRSSLQFDLIADLRSDLDKTVPTQTRILNDTFKTKGYSESAGGFFGPSYNIYVTPSEPPIYSYETYHRRFDILLITNYRNYSSDDGKSSYYGFFFDKGIGIEVLSFVKNTFTFKGTRTLTQQSLPDGNYYLGNKTYKTYIKNVKEYTYHFSGPQEIIDENHTQFIPVPTLGIGWQIAFKKLPLSFETKLSTGYRLNFYKTKPDYYENWFWNFAINLGYRF